MTWLELRDWAFREEKRLSDEGYWDGVDWPHVDHVEKWLKKCDKTIDQCVEYYTQTGEWGELARDDRVGLFYRLMWATQILTLLAHRTFDGETIVPDPAADADAVRKWVMIDMWEVLGRRTVVDWMRR